jgi:hypothetical protein
VWHVCAGDGDGDGVAEVVSTSARAQVHLVDSHGGKLKDLPVSIYANLVRVMVVNGEAQLLVGANGNSVTLSRWDEPRSGKRGFCGARRSTRTALK